MDPPESRRRRNRSRRRDDPRDHPASPEYDLGGGHRFQRGRQSQQQHHELFDQYPPQSQQQEYRQYSTDPYSDAGSHASHHRIASSSGGGGHNHHYDMGSHQAYQDATHHPQHGPLHQRLSQGHQSTRHSRHDDGGSWGTYDSFTYQSQQNANNNAHNRQQHHHYREEEYHNHQNERFVEVHNGAIRLPPDERYDNYYDGIIPNATTAAAAAAPRRSMLGRTSRSSSSLTQQHHHHNRSRSGNMDNINSLYADPTATTSSSLSPKKSRRNNFRNRRRGSVSMDDMLSLHIDEHSSDRRSFEEDQFIGGRNDNRRNNNSRIIRSSTSSIGSGRRRGRTRSDYSHGEDSDYVIGGSVHSMTRNHSLSRKGSDFSDDATYDELLDDSRMSSDNWSVSKSVFSTLPDRHHRRTRSGRGDGSFFDDDDGVGSVISTSSRGTAYSSYSSRQRIHSTTSSVNSRLSSHEGSEPSQSFHPSQASQTSSNQQHYKPARSKGNNFSYDSDDSINSLLDGFEGVRDDHIPSVVGSTEDDEENNVDNLSPQDPDELMSETEREQLAADFGDTRSHLKGLGISIDPSDEEMSDGEHDFDNMKDFYTDDKLLDKDKPWWISELERKGWFEHDTSTVYAKRNFTGRDQSAEDLDDENLDASGRDNGAPLTSANETVANDQRDDMSDTSTVGIVEEDDDDIENWEERLWSLARAHYLEYSGTSSDIEDKETETASATDNAPDEQSVKEQEQIYYDEYRAEQVGVLSFRSLLLKCLGAYVTSFHGNVKEGVKLNEQIGCAKDPEEKRDLEWTDHPIPLKVNRYVPKSLVQCLFAEVVNAEKDGVDDSGSMRDKDVDRQADIITSILIESDLSIFRCYQVITIKTSSKITTEENERSRKRLSKKSAKQSNSAQSELEEFLYGEMHVAEDEMKDDDKCTETKEIEVRLRSKVVSKLLGESDTMRSSWEEIVASNVILKFVQMIDVASTETTTNAEGETIVSTNKLEEQPMAQLYSLRNAPVFILRALGKLGKDVHVFNLNYDDGDPVHSDSSTNLVSYQDLTVLLRDSSYLLKRFELQGPYNGTITHLTDWESAFQFRNNCERRKRDDNEDYLSLHDLLVTTLHSHLQTTVKQTGYKFDAQLNENEDGTPEKQQLVTTGNYARIVATCLEIGRALHHLGVCLGRRHRDQTQKLNTKYAAGENDNLLGKRGVSLEIKAYKMALDAHKAAIYLLSEAEGSASQDDGDEDIVVAGNDDKQKNNDEDKAVRREKTEQHDSSDELHQIREAKISVELHLADTLTCLGYCHDAKLKEFEKALMAYRESLSLYIRHVGRFHRMVSNALHNMGAIHIELRQWKEAATCYRQCLAIVRRKEEQERAEWSQAGHHPGNIVENKQLLRPFVSSVNEDISSTLQCLGTSLAELGEYDASIASFQEVIDRLDCPAETDEKLSMPPSANVGEVMSQMASVHLKEASKVSQSLSWQCHMMIFSGTESKKSDDPHQILSRQLMLEKKGKECISRSIFSRRALCYCAVTKESKSVAIFSSSRSRRFSNSMLDSTSDEERTSYTIQEDAPSEVLESLASDLVAAGRLEFRARDYNLALSYFWESFLIRLFLCLRTTSTFDVIKDEFILNKELLAKEGAVLTVLDDNFGLIDLVDETVCPNNGPEFVQLLYLLGISYSRREDFSKAKEILWKAQHLHNELAAPSSDDKVIENIISQLDASMLHMGIGFHW